MISRIIATGSILALVLAASARAQDVLYVDENATEEPHNGSSWCHAYLTLHEALSAVEPDTIIRVADGTYRPDPSGLSHPRRATLQLLNDTTIEGGYAGCGADNPDERDIVLHETILSGDIGTAGDMSDNCFHVVTGSGTDETAVLDGLTVTAGNANSGNAPHYRGGGMYNEAGSPTLTNCTFRGNSGRCGAAMHNYWSDGGPTVTNCVFHDNSASSSGGAMCNYQQSHPTVINCTFYANTATLSGSAMSNIDCSSPTVTDCIFHTNSFESWSGGTMDNFELCHPTVTNCTFADNDGCGMWNSDGSNPTILNCTFSGNSSDDDWGGGMYNGHDSNPTVTDCAFSGNSARIGGGMSNHDGSSPVITNCTFSENSADFGGGGMYNDDDSNPLITNCTFSSNSADSAGAMYNQGSPVVINCVFTQNSATVSGAMYNHASSYSNPTVINCIFNGNTAAQRGGAMCNDCDPTVINCIFSGNVTGGDGSAIYNYSAGTPTLINCAFSGNSADDGGTLRNIAGSLVVSNCILWGNTPVEISGVATVTYSCVQGGCDGEGNIDADPAFVRNPDPGPDQEWGTADDDYGDLRLTNGSPCIDAGDNTAVPPDVVDLDNDGDTAERTPLDLDGCPRFVEDPFTENTGRPDPPYYRYVVDMGAYELQICFGDLDGDNDVDVADLAQLLESYGECSGMSYYDGDLDGDGDVDLADLAELLSVYGTICS